VSAHQSGLLSLRNPLAPTIEDFLAQVSPFDFQHFLYSVKIFLTRRLPLGKVSISAHDGAIQIPRRT
jgi:hypothetical protein